MFHRSELHRVSVHGRETARTLGQGTLHWEQRPENILIIKKARSPRPARPPVRATDGTDANGRGAAAAAWMRAQYKSDPVAQLMYKMADWLVADRGL